MLFEVNYTSSVWPPKSFIFSLCNMYFNSHYFDLEEIYTIITYCHNNNAALTGFSCLSTLQIGFNSHCIFQLTIKYLITRFNFKCHLLLSPRSGSSATCSQWSLCTGLNKPHLPEVGFSQHPLEYILPRKQLLEKCRSVWIIPSLYFTACRSVNSEIHVYHIIFKQFSFRAFTLLRHRNSTSGRKFTVSGRCSDFGGYVADQMQTTQEGLLQEANIFFAVLLVEHGHAMVRAWAAAWGNFRKNWVLW